MFRQKNYIILRHEKNTNSDSIACDFFEFLPEGNRSVRHARPGSIYGPAKIGDLLRYNKSSRAGYCL